MFEFFYSLLEYEFLQNAMLAGILSSIGCGLTGPFVVVNRISYLAGGIAHAVLGGMGAAMYFQIDPIIGAIIAALFSALLISYIKLQYNQQEDTVIGALWAVGMATGIIFISQTPGYNTELISYLFGNILMVSDYELSLMLVMDLVLLLVIGFFYKYLVAISFDQEFAKTRGIAVNFFYTLLMCLVAVTVVLLIQVVGLILVIALLTLPAAIASHYSYSIVKIMLVSIIGGILFTSTGLMVSYQADFPAGSTIIIIAGCSFLFSTLLKNRILRWKEKM